MLVFGASMNLMIFFSMAEDDTVLDDEDEELTWEAVVRAAGVREASKKTRSQAQKANSRAKLKTWSNLAPNIGAIEVDLDETEDVEGYKSNKGGEDESHDNYESGIEFDDSINEL